MNSTPMKRLNTVAFSLYPDQVDAVFLRWGLRDAALTHAFRAWSGMPEDEELSLLRLLAQNRCDAAGYMCSSKDIADQEFVVALADVGEQMAAAERLAVQAATSALQLGADRRSTMEAVIAAVIGIEPLPPENLLISAAEKAFSRHRWQERAWTKQGGRTA